MKKQNQDKGNVLNHENPLSKIKISRIIYPIAIGLGVVGYLFYREFDPNVFSYISLTKWGVLWLLVSIALMVFRDLGYILRLLILSEGSLTLRQAFRVIMLWEFTSAITPSVIGGTGVAIIYVNKEGIGVGRSSAIVMATSLLDELYFLIMFPLLLLIIKPGVLFGIGGIEGEISFSNELFLFAAIGYSLKLLYVLF
ncbi:MAG TPA: lysylphosphatidylglycerol synthase domain-containing protein, partial [Perlabentimonas sp.]|nr:lysylphosphatidylglycerol synthase domain-containing protein [Perlabentimonas sp.]